MAALIEQGDDFVKAMHQDQMPFSALKENSCLRTSTLDRPGDAKFVKQLRAQSQRDKVTLAKSEFLNTEADRKGERSQAVLFDL